MRAAALSLTMLVLGGTFLLMTAEAVRGGDWPGWDEGWALVAFPLGIPVAVGAAIATALRHAARPKIARLSLVATLAVWFWGAAIFAVWYALG